MSIVLLRRGNSCGYIELVILAKSPKLVTHMSSKYLVTSDNVIANKLNQTNQLNQLTNLT